MIEKYLTAKEALKLLNQHQNVPRQTLYRWAKEKKISSRKRGGILFFEQASIEQYIEKLTGETVEEIGGNTQTEINNEEELKKTISISREVLGAWLKTKHSEGVKEGQLLLTQKASQLENEKITLQSEKTILQSEKDILSQYLREEKIKKWISLGVLLLWTVGWIAYFTFLR
jgi:hypothetical protein